MRTEKMQFDERQQTLQVSQSGRVLVLTNEKEITVMSQKVVDVTKGETTLQTVERTVYEYDALWTDEIKGQPTYDSIVDAVVSAAYPQSKMQAIINNHLLGTEDDDCDDHEAEYNEMQQWRKMAKQTAKEALEKMEGLKN